jgi:hypothetical protein
MQCIHYGRLSNEQKGFSQPVRPSVKHAFVECNQVGRQDGDTGPVLRYELEDEHPYTVRSLRVRCIQVAARSHGFYILMAPM